MNFMPTEENDPTSGVPRPTQQQKRGDEGLWAMLMQMFQQRGVNPQDLQKAMAMMGQGQGQGAIPGVSASFGSNGGSVNVNLSQMLPLISGLFKQKPVYSADTASRNALPDPSRIMTA